MSARSNKCRSRRPYVLRLLILAIGCSFNQLPSQAQTSADKPPMLSPEFTVELPHTTSHAAWSPDGRVLAAIPSVHPALQLITVDTHERREWTAPFPFQLLSTAISPDNQLLAVHQPAKGVSTLLLYSISDRKEIARAEFPLGGCSLSAQLTDGLAFSLDGSSLWVGCHIAKDVAGSYPAAARLSLTDLRYQERLEFAPIAGRSLPHLRGSTFSISQGTLIWTQILTQYAPDRIPLRISQQFVHSIDLDNRQEVFTPLKIRTDPGGQLPSLLQYAMVSPQQGLAVVFRKLIKKEPAPPAGTPDFTFETYDIHTGGRLAEFWSAKDQQDVDSGGQVEHAALIPGSPYLVGAIDASFSPGKHGGLIVWNVRTGMIVQRVPGKSAQRVSVSPEGNRVALFSGKALLMYRSGR
jgi:hypothetical protein